jgi:hypothetical protein
MKIPRYHIIQPLPYTKVNLNLLFGKEREIGIISIISIIVFSNGLLFYLQNITEADLRKSVFEQEKQLQIQSTKEVAQHIGSDIGLVISMLRGLANSESIQQGQLGSEKTAKLLQDTYITYNLTIDRLFVLDKNDTLVANLASLPSEFFLGEDFSFRDWVKQTKITLSPVFAGDYEREGIYREFITFPIVNIDNGAYIGTIVTSIPTVQFFAHYGNVAHISSKFLAAYDKKGIILADGASGELVGKEFFGRYTQQFVNHNIVLDNLTRNLLAGNSGSAVYDYGKGERLTTSYPVFVNGKPIFFLQIVTPSSEIYSKVDSVLSIQRLKMFSLIAAASIVAIIVLLILLQKWNIILKKEVKRRTQELEDSYEGMKNYLESVLKEIGKTRTQN